MIIGFSPWLALAILAGVWITYIMLGIIAGNLFSARYVPRLLGWVGIFGAWAMVTDWGPGLIAITLVLIVMYTSERRAVREAQEGLRILYEAQKDKLDVP